MFASTRDGERPDTATAHRPSPLARVTPTARPRDDLDAGLGGGGQQLAVEPVTIDHERGLERHELVVEVGLAGRAPTG